MMSQPTHAPLRVLLVEDGPDTREGVVLHLRHLPDVALVGQAAHPAEALGLAEEVAPTMVLVDVILQPRPGRQGILERNAWHGIRLMRQLRRLALRTRPAIVALTNCGAREPQVVLNAIRAGVDGYLVKADCPDWEERAALLRRIAKGEFVASPTVAGLIQERYPDLDHPREFFEPLTAKELEVLALVEEGLSAAAIATRLHIQPSVVNEHTANIKAKLKADHKTELVYSAT